MLDVLLVGDPSGSIYRGAGRLRSVSTNYKMAKLVIAVQIMMIFLCNLFENYVLPSFKMLLIVFLVSLALYFA